MIHDVLQRAATSMHPEEALFAFIGIPAIAIGVFLIVLVRVWYSMRIRQWEMSLKHTMLERGMSAEEIKAVLEASSSKGRHRGSFPSMSWCGSKIGQRC